MLGRQTAHMKSNETALPKEIEVAVAQQQGGPVAVPGQMANYVVMNAEVYRDQMIAGSDADLEASVASLRVSLAQAAAGATLPLDTAAARLTEK